MDQLNFYSINFHTLVSHSVSQVERKLLCDTIESKRERKTDSSAASFFSYSLFLFFLRKKMFGINEKNMQSTNRNISLSSIYVRNRLA